MKEKYKQGKAFNQGFSKAFLTQWLYILSKGVLSNTSWNDGAYRNTGGASGSFSFGAFKRHLSIFIFLFNKEFL